MKLLALFCLTALCLGCSSPEVGTKDLANHFEEALRKNGELVFGDSSNLGASMDGSILTLHFFPDFKVRLYTWGNGFSNYSGVYEVTKENEITLSLSDQSWPDLKLSTEKGVFLLERKDGLTSLTRSYLHTNPKGVQTRVNDADIYPEARSLIFPLVQRIEPTEEIRGSDSAPRS